MDVVKLIVAATTFFATPALASDEAALIGDWELRIDGGGEIYTTRLELQPSADGDRVIGRYEDQGQAGGVTSVRREQGWFVVEFQAVRDGVRGEGVLSFELIDGKMVGDIDLDLGTSVRSYEFEARREGGKAVSVSIAEPAPNASTSRTVSFRQGVNGYESAIDTEVWAIAPSKPLDLQGTMTTDANNGGGESQVLMRFDGLFGELDGLVRPNSQVKRATLTVVAFDPGTTVYLHRVLIPWDGAATWDGLARGLSLDAVEASRVRDGFSFGEINMDKQAVEFDVTQTVQAWANGEPNQGWVFINTGGDGWDFYSSDWMEVDLRPSLEIEYKER